MPTFICHHILRTFRIPGHKIGLSYACLIHHLVTSLGAFFLDGVSRRTLCPIGHTTFSQSQSYVPSSSALVELAKHVDPTMHVDLIGDLLSTDPSDIPPSHPDILPSVGDIPSS